MVVEAILVDGRRLVCMFTIVLNVAIFHVCLLRIFDL